MDGLLKGNCSLLSAICHRLETIAIKVAINQIQWLAIIGSLTLRELQPLRTSWCFSAKLLGFQYISIEYIPHLFLDWNDLTDFFTNRLLYRRIWKKKELYSYEHCCCLISNEPEKQHGFWWYTLPAMGKEEYWGHKLVTFVWLVYI